MFWVAISHYWPAKIFRRWSDLLRDQATNAELNGSYVSLRHCLELAWPADKRIEAGGVRKSRLGRISTGEIITTNSGNTVHALFETLSLFKKPRSGGNQDEHQGSGQPRRQVVAAQQAG